MASALCRWNLARIVSSLLTRWTSAKVCDARCQMWQSSPQHRKLLNVSSANPAAFVSGSGPATNGRSNSGNVQRRRQSLDDHQSTSLSSGSQEFVSARCDDGEDTGDENSLPLDEDVRRGKMEGHSSIVVSRFFFSFLITNSQAARVVPRL